MLSTTPVAYCGALLFTHSGLSWHATHSGLLHDVGCSMLVRLAHTRTGNDVLQRQLEDMGETMEQQQLSFARQLQDAHDSRLRSHCKSNSSFDGTNLGDELSAVFEESQLHR